MSTDRLPEPNRKQLALVQEAARRALDGEKFKIFRDDKGRLCVVRVQEGEKEVA
jgi:hypothetical protein